MEAYGSKWIPECCGAFSTQCGWQRLPTRSLPVGIPGHGDTITPDLSIASDGGRRASWFTKELQSVKHHGRQPCWRKQKSEDDQTRLERWPIMPPVQGGPSLSPAPRWLLPRLSDALSLSDPSRFSQKNKRWSRDENPTRPRAFGLPQK